MPPYSPHPRVKHQDVISISQRGSQTSLDNSQWPRQRANHSVGSGLSDIEILKSEVRVEETFKPGYCSPLTVQERVLRFRKEEWLLQGRLTR